MAPPLLKSTINPIRHQSRSLNRPFSLLSDFLLQAHCSNSQLSRRKMVTYPLQTASQILHAVYRLSDQSGDLNLTFLLSKVASPINFVYLSCCHKGISIDIWSLRVCTCAYSYLLGWRAARKRLVAHLRNGTRACTTDIRVSSSFFVFWQDIFC